MQVRHFYPLVKRNKQTKQGGVSLGHDFTMIESNMKMIFRSPWRSRLTLPVQTVPVEKKVSERSLVLRSNGHMKQKWKFGYEEIDQVIQTDQEIQEKLILSS